MKFVKFTLKHNQAHKAEIVDLNSDVNIFFSEKNSTGKTTLMRAILYTLGFSIPNTELVQFDNFEFTLEVINKDKTYNVIRKSQLLIIDKIEYDLPTDMARAHTYLFGIENKELLSNILGTIYFDQEKGWTLLNRGTIIGENRFKIESFFRGLNGGENDDSYKIAAVIEALNKKIEQYRLMFNVSEYQESLSLDVEQKFEPKSYIQTLDEELLAKKQQLEKIENEIAGIDKLIEKNQDFSIYITKMKLCVKNPQNNTPIRVTSDTLLNFDDLQETHKARRNVIIAERNQLKKEIADREQAQKKEITLLDLPTVDEELTHRFSAIQRFSSLQVKSMLDKFTRERDDLANTLKMRATQNNNWATDAHKSIADYAKKLKIPKEYKLDIFTSNLKAKSGAILYKMVFIYKITYIQLLSKKLDYPLPIFCDSPYRFEVEKETIEEVLNVLKSDLLNHQIIIASIHDYKNIYPQANIVTLDGTLFNDKSQTMLSDYQGTR